MQLKNAEVTFTCGEVSERILALLKEKSVSGLTVRKVELGSGWLRVFGRYSGVFDHDFLVRFAYSVNYSRQELALKLEYADVDNTWWMPMTDFAIVNAALASGIDDSKLMRYSWSDEELTVSIPEAVRSSGVAMSAKLTYLFVDENEVLVRFG